MGKFKLEILNNGLQPGKDNEISFQASFQGTDAPEILRINLDLASIKDTIEWGRVEGRQPEMRCKKTGSSVQFAFEEAQPLLDKLVLKIINVRLLAGHDQPRTGVIEISFVEKSNKSHKVSTEVVIDGFQPEIEKFEVRPSIAQKGVPITIFYKFHSADTCHLSFNNMSVKSIDCPDKGVVEGSFIYQPADNCPSASRFGLHLYAGNVNATAHKPVKLSKFKAWDKVTQLIEYVQKAEGGETVMEPQPNKLIDLVLNEYDGKMWGWAVPAPNPANARPRLWYTGDGLNWQPYKDKNGKDVTIISELAHCPACHLNGKLYFVCGSKVDLKYVSQKITVLDFKNNYPTSDMDTESVPRSLHACVVFPFEGKDQIWIIGGVDEFGNGLKDVLRFDTAKCYPVDTPAGFSERCRFSATVHTQGNEQSIWIAGGARSDDGDSVNDIWAFNLNGAKNTWQQIKQNAQEPLQLNTGGEQRRVDGIALTSLHRTWVNEATEPEYLLNVIDLYRLSDGKYYYWGNIFRKAQTDSLYPYNYNSLNPVSPNWDSSKSERMSLVSIAFNGCIWLLLLQDEEDRRISASKLFFISPTIS